MQAGRKGLASPSSDFGRKSTKVVVTLAGLALLHYYIYIYDVINVILLLQHITVYKYSTLAEFGKLLAVAIQAMIVF